MYNVIRATANVVHYNKYTTLLSLGVTASLIPVATVMCPALIYSLGYFR